MKLLIIFLIIFIIYISQRNRELFNGKISAEILQRTFGDSQKSIKNIPIANKEQDRFPNTESGTVIFPKSKLSRNRTRVEKPKKKLQIETIIDNIVETPTQTDNTTEDEIKQKIYRQTRYKINSSIEIKETIISFRNLNKTQNLESFITLNYPKFTLKTLPHIIKGDLIINGFFNPRKFNNVSTFETRIFFNKILNKFLYFIEEIEGDLIIVNNIHISDTYGLSNLKKIGKNLIIQNNDVLNNICNLNLDNTNIGGNVTIKLNPDLRFIPRNIFKGNSTTNHYYVSNDLNQEVKVSSSNPNMFCSQKQSGKKLLNFQLSTNGKEFRGDKYKNFMKKYEFGEQINGNVVIRGSNITNENYQNRTDTLFLERNCNNGEDDYNENNLNKLFINTRVINGDVEISNCPKVTNLSAFSNIEINGNITISNNQFLNDICGLSKSLKKNMDSKKIFRLDLYPHEEEIKENESPPRCGLIESNYIKRFIESFGNNWQLSGNYTDTAFEGLIDFGNNCQEKKLQDYYDVGGTFTFDYITEGNKTNYRMVHSTQSEEIIYTLSEVRNRFKFSSNNNEPFKGTIIIKGSDFGESEYYTIQRLFWNVEEIDGSLLIENFNLETPNPFIGFRSLKKINGSIEFKNFKNIISLDFKQLVEIGEDLIISNENKPGNSQGIHNKKMYVALNFIRLEIIGNNMIIKNIQPQNPIIENGEEITFGFNNLYRCNKIEIDGISSARFKDDVNNTHFLKRMSSNNTGLNISIIGHDNTNTQSQFNIEKQLCYLFEVVPFPILSGVENPDCSSCKQTGENQLFPPIQGIDLNDEELNMTMENNQIQIINNSINYTLTIEQFICSFDISSFKINDLTINGATDDYNDIINAVLQNQSSINTLNIKDSEGINIDTDISIKTIKLENNKDLNNNILTFLVSDATESIEFIPKGRIDLLLDYKYLDKIAGVSNYLFKNITDIPNGLDITINTLESSKIKYIASILYSGDISYIYYTKTDTETDTSPSSWNNIVFKKISINTPFFEKGDFKMNSEKIILNNVSNITTLDSLLEKVSVNEFSLEILSGSIDISNFDIILNDDTIVVSKGTKKIDIPYDSSFNIANIENLIINTQNIRNFVDKLNNLVPLTIKNIIYNINSGIDFGNKNITIENEIKINFTPEPETDSDNLPDCYKDRNDIVRLCNLITGNNIKKGQEFKLDVGNRFENNKVLLPSLLFNNDGTPPSNSSYALKDLSNHFPCDPNYFGEADCGNDLEAIAKCQKGYNHNRQYYCDGGTVKQILKAEINPDINDNVITSRFGNYGKGTNNNYLRNMFINLLNVESVDNCNPSEVGFTPNLVPKLNFIPEGTDLSTIANTTFTENVKGMFADFSGQVQCGYDLDDGNGPQSIICPDDTNFCKALTDGEKNVLRNNPGKDNINIQNYVCKSSDTCSSVGGDILVHLKSNDNNLMNYIKEGLNENTTYKLDSLTYESGSRIFVWDTIVETEYFKSINFINGKINKDRMNSFLNPVQKIKTRKIYFEDVSYDDTLNLKDLIDLYLRRPQLHIKNSSFNFKDTFNTGSGQRLFEGFTGTINKYIGYGVFKETSEVTIKSLVGTLPAQTYGNYNNDGTVIQGQNGTFLTNSIITFGQSKQNINRYPNRFNNYDQNNLGSIIVNTSTVNFTSNALIHETQTENSTFVGDDKDNLPELGIVVSKGNNTFKNLTINNLYLKSSDNTFENVVIGNLYIKADTHLIITNNNLFPYVSNDININSSVSLLNLETIDVSKIKINDSGKLIINESDGEKDGPIYIHTKDKEFEFISLNNFKFKFNGIINIDPDTKTIKLLSNTTLNLTNDLNNLVVLGNGFDFKLKGTKTIKTLTLQDDFNILSKEEGVIIETLAATESVITKKEGFNVFKIELDTSGFTRNNFFNIFFDEIPLTFRIIENTLKINKVNVLNTVNNSIYSSEFNETDSSFATPKFFKLSEGHNSIMIMYNNDKTININVKELILNYMKDIIGTRISYIKEFKLTNPSESSYPYESGTLTIKAVSRMGHFFIDNEEIETDIIQSNKEPFRFKFIDTTFEINSGNNIKDDTILNTYDQITNTFGLIRKDNEQTKQIEIK